MSSKQMKLLVALATAIVMTGCAVVDHSVAKYQGQSHTGEVNERFELARTAPDAPRVKESDGIWVNKRATSSKEEVLPQLFRQPYSVAIEVRTPLKEILNDATRTAGLRFVLGDDVRGEIEAVTLPAGYKFSGDLKGFIEQQTAVNGVSWKYRGGAVEIFRFDTQVFQIAAVPGVTDLQTTVGNRSGGSGQSAAAGGSTGGSAGSQLSMGQDVRYALKLEFWNNLKNDLKNLVSRDGKNALFTVSETTSTVTVTATAPTLAAVESFIHDTNASRTRQVWLDVRAYTVDNSSGRDFGVAWDAAYTKLAKDLGVTMTSPQAVTSSLGALTAVLGPSSTSALANTKVMINALSSIGNATLAAESTQMVPSGEVVPMTRMREVAYLAEVQSSSVVNAGTQTSLKPGVVTEGFAMSILPVVVSGDTVLLKGSIDISSIDKIESQSSGGQTIRTPQRSMQSMPMTVYLKSGQTYVYGLREILTSYADSGVTGTALVDVLAGRQRSSKEGRKTVVITVTPRIVNTAAL